MEPTAPGIGPAHEAEHVLLDALLVAHRRHADTLHEVCVTAVADDRDLTAADVGGLLVAQAELDLIVVTATFDVRDHWARFGSAHPGLHEFRVAIEAAADLAHDRERVLDALRLSLARARLRARELEAQPWRLGCDVFFAEVTQDREDVEEVAGELLDAGRDLYLSTVSLDEA
ncbi:MAG: hypothetical protein J7518_06455 [Nocardioidaceae bacterium]|nr:hypothetical protein [Nocardioidaceae bacterium]